MNKKTDIQPFEQDTKNVIQNTLNDLAEGITGIATTPKKELILSVSHAFQKMRGGQFLSVLLEEWEGYKDKGRIKEDYQYTEQHKVCLQELLEFLDKDSPNEIRFKVLKQIFLVAATEKLSDRNSFLPQQFIKIARSLNDGEILVLTTVWNIARENIRVYGSHNSATRWIQEVTEESGLKYKSLVEIYESELMEKRLISPRTLGDGSGVIIKPNYRLTDLGFDFCHFIENYDE